MMQYINKNDLEVVFSKVRPRLNSDIEKACFGENKATFQKIKYKDLTIGVYSSLSQKLSGDIVSNFTFYIPLSRDFGKFSLIPKSNKNSDIENEEDSINNTTDDNLLSILIVIIGLNILGIILILVAKKYDFSLLKYYGIFFLIMFVPALFKILKEILMLKYYPDNYLTKAKRSSENKLKIISIYDKYHFKVEEMPVFIKQLFGEGEIGKRFAEYNFNFTSLEFLNNTAILKFNKKILSDYDKEIKSFLKEAIDCTIILSDFTFLYPDSNVSNPSDNDTFALLEQKHLLGLPANLIDYDNKKIPPDLS